MKGKPGDRQRLLHILEAISEIETYTNDTEIKSFLANYITPETKEKFSDLEWGQIIGMRHILVHEYFGMDFDLIWQVIIKDLPILKQKVSAILNSLQ